MDIEALESTPTEPVPLVDFQPRCWRCGRMLTRFFFARPWKIECARCKAKCASDPPEVQHFPGGSVG